MGTEADDARRRLADSIRARSGFRIVEPGREGRGSWVSTSLWVVAAVLGLALALLIKLGAPASDWQRLNALEARVSALEEVR